MTISITMQSKRGTGGRAMTELKPCPFCGDIHPTVLDTIDGDPIIPCFVLCSFCSARINGPNRHDAIEAWNRRASDDPV